MHLPSRPVVERKTKKSNSPCWSLRAASSRVLGLGLCLCLLLLVDWSTLAWPLLAMFWLAETARWDMLCTASVHTSRHHTCDMWHVTCDMWHVVTLHALDIYKQVMTWWCEPSLAGWDWHAGNMLCLLSGQWQQVYPGHGHRPTWRPVPGAGGGAAPPLRPGHHDGGHQVCPPPVGCEHAGGQSTILS